MSSDEVHVELGRRIREARKAKGLTQRDVGAGLGVTFQQVQKYENGKSQLSVAMLLSFAALLDLPPATLIAGLGADSETVQLTPSERDLIKSLRAIGNRNVERAMATLLQAIKAEVGSKSRAQRS